MEKVGANQNRSLETKNSPDQQEGVAVKYAVADSHGCVHFADDPRRAREAMIMANESYR